MQFDHYIKYKSRINYIFMESYIYNYFQKSKEISNTNFSTMFFSGWEEKRYFGRESSEKASKILLFLYLQLCSSTWIFILLFFKMCKYGIHLYMYTSRLKFVQKIQ